MASCVDFQRLQEFAGGDPALERELCSLYLATAERYLAGLTDGLGGARGWTAAAHGLKGASANFGAHELAGLAAEAEAGAPDGALLMRLRDALRRSRSLIERHLAVTSSVVDVG